MSHNFWDNQNVTCNIFIFVYLFIIFHIFCKQVLNVSLFWDNWNKMFGKHQMWWLVIVVCKCFECLTIFEAVEITLNLSIKQCSFQMFQIFFTQVSNVLPFWDNWNVRFIKTFFRHDSDHWIVSVNVLFLLRHRKSTRLKITSLLVTIHYVSIQMRPWAKVDMLWIIFDSFQTCIVFLNFIR